MALSTRAVLRPFLATATLVALAGAGASAAQDVGGAAAPRDGYRGRFLDWAGKSPAPPAAPAPAPTPPESSSDVAEATYVAPRPTAPALEAAPQRATPPPAIVNAAPASYMPPPTPPPATERAPLAPAAAPSAPVAYMPPPKAPPATRVTPLAPATPARAAASAPAQNAYAAGPDASPRVHVRFYSVDRPYGLTPDPIKMPTKRPMILVGPPDATANHSQDGASDDASNGDKSAPHDDAQGGADDPSGDN